MGGAIALEFDPNHHHRLHGHQLVRADISTALVDEFDLARLFDRHPTVTPMSLYHVLAHKLDVYCTTLLLPSQKDTAEQQFVRQRINAIYAALQTKNLITEFPGFDDCAAFFSKNGLGDVLLDSTSGMSPSVKDVGKVKSEFHRVDDARSVILFLTVDYLAALNSPHNQPENTLRHHSPPGDIHDESTATMSENGTINSNGSPSSRHIHGASHTTMSGVHAGNASDTTTLTDEDIVARDRCWREFQHIQRSLPAKKIIPVIVENGALQVVDWPVPLQRLYYPHLFLHPTASSPGISIPQPTAEYFQTHTLTHIVHCQPPHDPVSTGLPGASSSLFGHFHNSNVEHGNHSGFRSMRSSFTNSNTSNSIHVDKLYDTVMHVIMIPLKILIQEEMDRVLARSSSLSLTSSTKINLNDGDVSGSSRNSSRPQSSTPARRSFTTLTRLSPEPTTAALQPHDAASPAAAGSLSHSSSETGFAGQQLPLVSSVIHFFVVEGHIAPPKAREYATVMAQQDHLESIPALKHYLQHQNPDYLQMKLGMTELEANRMMQLLLRATTDIQEIRRRCSLGGGELSSSMMDHVQQQAHQQQQEQGNSQIHSKLANSPSVANSLSIETVGCTSGSSKKNSVRRRSDGSSYVGTGGVISSGDSQRRIGEVSTGSGRIVGNRHRSSSTGSGSNSNSNLATTPTPANGNSMMQMMMNTVSSMISSSSSPAIHRKGSTSNCNSAASSPTHHHSRGLSLQLTPPASSQLPMEHDRLDAGSAAAQHSPGVPKFVATLHEEAK
jgi:hypothetical protein